MSTSPPNQAINKEDSVMQTLPTMIETRKVVEMIKNAALLDLLNISLNQSEI